MALPTNARGRAEATTQNTTPNVYNDKSYAYMYERVKLLGILDDQSSRLLNKPGNSIDLYKETQWTVNPLTEGTATPISPLVLENEQLVLQWYGDSKMISLETLSEEFEFVFDRHLNRSASYALGENKDIQILVEFANTTTAAVYPLDGAGVRLTSVTTPAGAAGAFSDEQASEARKQIIKAGRDTEDRYLIISPEQEKALRDSSKFQSNETYPASILIKGVIGTIHGFQVIVHRNVQTFAGTHIDTPTLYQAFAVTKDCGVYAQKVNPIYEFDRETKRARTLTFLYHEAFGIKNLYDEAIIPLVSNGDSVAV